MKSRKEQLISALSRLGGTLVVLAIVVVPALTSLKAFRVSADPNKQEKLAKIQPLAARPQDKQSIKPFNQPLISVTFDDGWESVYTDGLPVLQEDGIPTTQYIIAGEFSNPAYMTYDQVKAFKGAGHDIGSHTMTHPDLTTLSEDQLFYQLSESKNVLSAFQPNVRDFATPYSSSNATTEAYVKRLYRSNRLSDGTKTFNPEKDINMAVNFNPYAINAFAVTRQTNIATIQSYIDYTVAHNGWLVLVYHQINDNPGDDYGVSKKDFKQQMDLVSKTNIRVATLGQVIDAMPQVKR
jgi:peptidoglycan/xylan/chitin deacetylase (PgdA/CDA1 family)